MKKNLILLFVLVNTLAFASTVEWHVLSYAPAQDGYEYETDILSGASPSGGFGFAAYFTKEWSPLYAILSCNIADVPFFLGNDYSWWRVVNKGDLVDYNSMITPHDDYFSYYPGVMPIGMRDISIPLTDSVNGNTIVIAFATAPWTSWDGAPYFYGWVELGYDGEDIFIVDSAMEMTGLGILAGTGIVVPEPSSALFALTGLAVLAIRRRRECSTGSIACDKE